MATGLVQLCAVMLGGALGAAARYGVVSLLSPGGGSGESASRVPWGVLAVNLAGCLAIGVLAGAWESRGGDERVRLLVMTGLLGSFTTFSAFGMDTLTLLRAGAVWLAAGYVGASVVLGVLLAAGGWLIGRGMTG